jgi:hypothetical protein
VALTDEMRMRIKPPHSRRLGLMPRQPTAPEKRGDAEGDGCLHNLVAIITVKTYR